MVGVGCIGMARMGCIGMVCVYYRNSRFDICIVANDPEATADESVIGEDICEDNTPVLASNTITQKII